MPWSVDATWWSGWWGPRGGGWGRQGWLGAVPIPVVVTIRWGQGGWLRIVPVPASPLAVVMIIRGGRWPGAVPTSPSLSTVRWGGWLGAVPTSPPLSPYMGDVPIGMVPYSRAAMWGAVVLRLVVWYPGVVLVVWTLVLDNLVLLGVSRLIRIAIGC